MNIHIFKPLFCLLALAGLQGPALPQAADETPRVLKDMSGIEAALNALKKGESPGGVLRTSGVDVRKFVALRQKALIYSR